MAASRHIARMGKMKNAYNVSLGKPKEKRRFRRPRRRWEKNIKINIKE
jgi:hypothetical protein